MDKAKPFGITKREVWEAYKRVKANRGTAGVDDQTIEEFDGDLENNLYRLWNRLCSGSAAGCCCWQRCLVFAASGSSEVAPPIRPVRVLAAFKCGQSAAIMSRAIFPSPHGNKRMLRLAHWNSSAGPLY